MTVVWYSAWQMACCGEPFAVGDRVEWPLDEPDTDWLEAAIGADQAARGAYAEEHHPRDEEPPKRAGRVVGIQRAWCEFAPRVADDRTLYPVAGSARLLDVNRSDGIEEHAFSGLQFNGWVVELDLADE